MPFTVVILVFNVQNAHHIVRAYGYQSGVIAFQLLRVLKKMMTLCFGLESVCFFWPCFKFFYEIVVAAFISKDQHLCKYVHKLE